MVEQIGSGISRIRQSIQEAGLVEPYFNLEGMFSVTLYRPFNFELWIDIYWKEKLNNSQYQILIQIHKNNHISKSNLLTLVGISKTAIDKNINKLKELGILERIGGDRGGYWKVIKKKSEGG
jgi:ATP-dependent DNA helicase RecG